MAEITITKDNFEQEVLQSSVPVLVDFWATWCGPCRMQAPVLAALAEELGNKVKVGKINVDEEMELAVGFKVSSIPTLIVFKDGKAVQKTIGFSSREQLLSLLEM